MVATGNWALNVLYWWTNTFIVTPPLGLLGIVMGIFADWQFSLSTAIEMIGIFRYPDIEGAYNKSFKGNTITEKKFVYVPDQNANYKYAWEEISPTGATLSTEEFKKALRDSNKGLTERQITSIIDFIDNDGSSTVDYNEFVASLKYSGDE